jgi:hypothetical protein
LHLSHLHKSKKKSSGSTMLTMMHVSAGAIPYAVRFLGTLLDANLACSAQIDI